MKDGLTPGVGAGAGGGGGGGAGGGMAAGAAAVGGGWPKGMPCCHNGTTGEAPGSGTKLTTSPFCKILVKVGPVRPGMFTCVPRKDPIPACDNPCARIKS